jgi:hypothetical protein
MSPVIPNATQICRVVWAMLLAERKANTLAYKSQKLFQSAVESHLKINRKFRIKQAHESEDKGPS